MDYTAFIWSIEQGGLTGQYWDNQWFSNDPIHTRQDSRVHFNWENGIIVGQAADYLAVRWTGFMKIDNWQERHLFTVDADDGSRLWINGQKIFDSWESAGIQQGLSKIIE